MIILIVNMVFIIFWICGIMFGGNFLWMRENVSGKIVILKFWIVFVMRSFWKFGVKLLRMMLRV